MVTNVNRPLLPIAVIVYCFDKEVHNDANNAPSDYINANVKGNEEQAESPQEQGNDLDCNPSSWPKAMCISKALE